MKFVPVVIGAGYGDEGKGRITAKFAKDLSADYVVRFNGGAQAGHTVVSDGKRVVFSHLSSGSFSKAATVFGQNFLIFPSILFEEHAQFHKQTGIDVECFAHPKARISFDFDVIINRALEESRGNSRHGSCGIGVFETVNRGNHGFNIRFEDLTNMDHCRMLFSKMMTEWVPQRVAALGLDLAKVMKSIDEVHQHRDPLVQLQLLKSFVNEWRFIDHDATFVFEGAQGLQLSETFMDGFPHLTPSDTGVRFAMQDASDLAIPFDALEPVYVTRMYKTRHGAGALKHEGELIGVELAISDPTNAPNDWQGTLRFAPLCADELVYHIERDIEVFDPLRTAPVSIAVTCQDQTPNGAFVYADGEAFSVKDAVELTELLNYSARRVTSRALSYRLVTATSAA